LSNRKISPGKASRGKDFKVGEKVMAVWHNNKRYPAQITKVLEPGKYLKPSFNFYFTFLQI
jgi:hypothetical protein